MRSSRIQLLLSMILGAALFGSGGQAAEATYPSQTIKIIVPFPHLTF